MKKKEFVAIIIVIITMICLIVLPRLYYHVNNPADTIDIITAIYATSAVEVNAIYATSVVQIGLLAGLIIAFRK